MDWIESVGIIVALISAIVAVRAAENAGQHSYDANQTLEDANAILGTQTSLQEQANAIAQEVKVIEARVADFEMSSRVHVFATRLKSELLPDAANFTVTNVGRAEIVQLQATVTSLTRKLEVPMSSQGSAVLLKTGDNAVFTLPEADRMQDRDEIGVAYLICRWQSAGETIDAWWSIMPVEDAFHLVPLKNTPELPPLPG